MGWCLVVGGYWGVRFGCLPAPPGFAERAPDPRAVAALEAWRALVAQTEAAPPSAAASQTPDAFADTARLEADVRALAFPRATPEARARALDWLEDTVRSRLVGRAEVALQRWSYPGGTNLVVERAPGAPGAGHILVGAHYDTVEGTPGADDNATGLAASLAVLAVWAPRPTPRGLKVVFFDQEELGLRGSRAYAERLRDTHRAHLEAVVVLEMLGSTCAETGCQRLPEGLPLNLGVDRGDFLAAVGNASAIPMMVALRSLGAARGLPVRALPILGEGQDFPHARRSDHAPFWDLGLPAVMLTDTAELRTPHYHAVTDTPDRLDYDFLTRTTKTALDLVGALLAEGPSLKGSGAAPGSSP